MGEDFSRVRSKRSRSSRVDWGLPQLVKESASGICGRCCRSGRERGSWLATEGLGLGLGLGRPCSSFSTPTPKAAVLKIVSIECWGTTGLSWSEGSRVTRCFTEIFTEILIIDEIRRRASEQ